VAFQIVGKGIKCYVKNFIISGRIIRLMKTFKKGLSKEGDILYPLYVIKGRNPL